MIASPAVETLMEIADALGYIQTHGGLMMLVVIVVMVRGVDMYQFNKKLEGIERRSLDRIGTHELYWHNTGRRNRRAEDKDAPTEPTTPDSNHGG